MSKMTIYVILAIVGKVKIYFVAKKNACENARLKRKEKCLRKRPLRTQRKMLAKTRAKNRKGNRLRKRALKIAKIIACENAR